jgi:hypothetical protein
MNIYLSVDDTDNTASIGSGQLAENLTKKIILHNLAQSCSNITRHQLFYHDDIPYTSHNSAMCFKASIEPASLSDLISFSSTYLKNNSAAGSDPGLCIVEESENLKKDVLIEFGKQAKSSIVTKDNAYQLANKLHVHLSEHGGTGDGVIGALAGIGLRLDGNDGRFRGWLQLGKTGDEISAAKLSENKNVDNVVDENGQPLPSHSVIRIADEKIKTILQNHMQVIPVTSEKYSESIYWRTLSRKEVKKF